MIDKFFTIVPPWLIILLIIFNVMLGAAAYLILLERKVASWVQDRIGPNRVGPKGLLQPMADGLKMFTKEDFRSSNTDRTMFTFAPILMILVVFTAMALIPWGGIYQGTLTYVSTTASAADIPSGSTLVAGPIATGNPDEYNLTYRFPVQIADMNIGVLYILAVLAMVVYSVVLGSWASNNKFSFLGGMRAAAQMISYEVPLGLSIITIVLMFGTLSLSEITTSQARYWVGFIPAWNIFCQPLAFVMFLICIHAEANRAPFDLAEAEQELVGGYHTEYTSMRLGLLLMGEYIEMVVTSAVLVALFLGGWHFPGLTGNVDPNNPAVTTSILEIALRISVFFAKITLVIGVFMWVRWTLPRFRYDQLMNVAWRGMVPISLCLMLGTALVVYATHTTEVVEGQRLIVTGQEALLYLAMNLVLIVLFAIGAMFLPRIAANKRIAVPGSRFASEFPAATPD